MSKHNKTANSFFSIFILTLNSFFLTFELEQLFRIERYIDTYGRSARISESIALEMQYINQLRESIGTWVTIISVVFFLFMILKYKKYIVHFFYIVSAINLFFLIGTIVLSVLGPFHIIELVAALTIPLLINLVLGFRLFVNFFKTKHQYRKLRQFSK
ncbi:hypothetical protein [Alkalibacterium olivapovliticus]|uniref:Uncharacterized protein n=1 Tax=Alkalibacterium olivapovliticus TaxID=99907 RepID=A0A2T0VW22_9LACT|nr:hypothetical protein [Alkalibacterium olivapovliticus]PRY75909.1 hypothetical protein CLV38_13314 [Alkalibacterium olivapovliticus]